jgi:predicted DNA-binding protein with PD1-like motif
MPLSFTPVATQGLRVFMGVITDGEPLHQALAHVAAAHDIGAATVALLGGLTEVELTAYDFATQQRLPPRVYRGSLEIVAGHGTISRLEGQPHVHLHLVLACRDATAGMVLVGGHVARALAFAVEFTLTAYDGVVVSRRPHASTGLALWAWPEG